MARRSYAPLVAGKVPPTCIPDPLPAGLIALWKGPVPPGWHPCDGKAGRPSMEPKNPEKQAGVVYIIKGGS